MTTTAYTPALYTGNNTTPTYSFSFKIFEDADLRVVQTDTNAVETVLVLNTGYTVTGAGTATGGSITLTAGNLATGYKLKIGLGLAITQPTSIRNQSAYYASVHEDVFDRLTKIDQQQDEKLGRVPMIREGLTGVDMALPDPVAGAALGWDARGTGLGNLLGGSAGTLEDAKALTLADLASTATGKGDELLGVKRGTVSRTQHDINAESASLGDYPDLGAALAAGKARIYVPAGNHDTTALITATLTAPCVLFGEGTIRYTGASSTGNILAVDCAGYDFRIEGLTFDGQDLVAGGPKISNTTAMTAALPDFALRGCTLKNFKMNAAAVFNAGAYVRGSFETVEVSGNTVKDITRLAGTGTPGSSGTMGIFVGHTDATHYVRHCRHFGNTYDNISGGDAVGSANNVDHDAFMFFTPDPSNFTNSDGTIFRYAPASVVSYGNSYKNCRGRAIKVQGIAEVSKEKVIRDADYTNYGGSTEINLQWGVGSVRDCVFFYNDYSAGAASPIQSSLTLVDIYQGSSYGENIGGAVVDGLTVYNSIKAGVGSNPTAILGAYAGATVITKNRPLITLRNVCVNRGTFQHIATLTQSAGSYGLLRMDSIVMDKIQYSAIGTGGVNTNVDVVATAVTHLDGVSTPANIKPWMTVTGSATATTYLGAMTGFGNRGWDGTYSSGSYATAFPTLKGGVLAAPDQMANNGGTASIQTVSLADAGISSLSLRGYTSGRGLAFVSASYDFNTQGLIVMGDGKVAVVGAPGTHVFSPSVTVDTELDGGAGKVNLWMTSAGELKIRNRLGSTRQFTVMFFG